jgi:hypothetical protein
MQWAGTIIARCVLISTPACLAHHIFFHNVLALICTGVNVMSSLMYGRATTMRGEKMEKRRDPTSEGAGLTARPSG